MYSHEYDLEWSTTSVCALLRVCRRKGRILALMQDNPDPDGIASALAFCRLVLQKLGKHVTVGYGGTIGRAENQAMVDLLRVDAERMVSADLARFDILCLVDTQPRSGNNVLLGARPAQIVIDHHFVPPNRTWTAEVTDVRPHYGATSTILYEYLVAARVDIPQDLATALYYGIQSDTQDLGRETCDADVAAFQALFQRADKRLLSRIRRAPVPASYFRTLHNSLDQSVVAGKTIVTAVSTQCHPEMIAEVAELMLRLKGMRASVCYGLCGPTVHISVRTTDFRSNASMRIQKVVADIGRGGGHRMMAGGQVPAGDSPERTVELVRRRILEVFAPGKKAVPLLQLIDE
jgi:nanoRNase/pAp phosphatase (c-di-AMP/oligoRNAs hydrolase)